MILVNREPVRRAYGLENEYSNSLPEGQRLRPLSHQFPPGIRRAGFFLENGSNLHVDIETVFEHAIPTVLAIQDLVTHEIAGERIVWQAYQPPRTNILSMHKRAIDPSETYGYGMHESYSTTVNVNDPDEKRKEYVIAALALHNATRTPLIGAGRVRPNGEFSIGQKMEKIYDLASSNTTMNRPLVNTRGEHHDGGVAGLYRLHVTSGDGNISPLSMSLKAGGYSSFLRLLEQGVPIDDLFPTDSVVDMARQVAGPVEGMLIPFETRSAGTMTALNIQEELINREKELATEVQFPDDELRLLDDSLAVVQHLPDYVRNGSQTKLLTQLDWIARRQLMKEVRDLYEAKGVDPKKIIKKQQAYDLMYDQLPGGIGIKQRGRRFTKYMPTEDEILDAMTTPPPGRGQLIGAAVKTSDELGLEIGVTWDMISYRNRIFKLGPANVSYSQGEVDAKMVEIFS